MEEDSFYIVPSIRSNYYLFSKVSGYPGMKILNWPVLREALNPSSNYRGATLNLYNIFKG